MWWISLNRGCSPSFIPTALAMFGMATSLSAQGLQGAAPAGTLSSVITIPSVHCIPAGEEYIDSLAVFDFDLQRTTGRAERIHAWAEDPTLGFEISPAVVSGPIGDGRATFTIRSNAVPSTPGRVRIRVLVADEATYLNGGEPLLVDYYITVSRPTPFRMPLKVSAENIVNGNRSSQTMEFGVGDRATTGYEGYLRSRMDSDYCEYELPPLPPIAMFDARWTLPETNGLLRNIYPVHPDPAQVPARAWIGSFQPGTDGGIENWPVRITWRRSDAQRYARPLTLRDQLGAVFAVDMKTGATGPVPGITVKEIDADIMEVAISLTSIAGFKIDEAQTSGVATGTVTGGTAGSALTCSPNPTAEGTTVRYTMARGGRATIELFDNLGHPARTLFDGTAEAGEHTAAWDGTDAQGRRCPSGTYACRLSTAEGAVWTRIVLSH